MTLNEVLTKRRIRSWAGSRSYERGEEYFLSDRVVRLSERNEKITAVVAGSHNYRVRLWVDEDELDYACDCPVGRRDDFCKHCVAVALQWLQPDNAAGKATQQPDCRAWLMQQDKEALVELLLDIAGEDEALQNRLTLGAAAAASDFDLDTHKEIIRQTIDSDVFIDYRETYDYSRRIDDVIDSIGELLDQGRAEAVIELSEYALQQVERAIEHVDDSDGFMSQLLDRLQEIHLAACSAANPDPKTLAEKLFNWELKGDWDTFRSAALTYSEVLGDEGLKHYRALAEAEWAGISPLGPGDKDANRYGLRFNITHIMESLAHLTGNLEELIAIKQRDLSSSYAYLNIAQACQHAGADDQALAWAEKGVAAFRGNPDSRLIKLLATLYHGQERHDEAMKLIWPRFERAPSLATYMELKQASDHQQSWPAWRQRALEFIQGKIHEAGSDHSLLVEILMWEDDIEAAWQEASNGGCDEYLWVKLARLRETQHPRDAIPIYRRQIGPIVERTNNNAYAEAVVLIRRIKKLMAKLGDDAEFRGYLDTLRSDFKRKRNFMKMLDGL